MASDDEEDDYLSDKFLAGPPASSSSSVPSISSRPKTYSELRKEALRLSEAKNAASRKKSRREIVEEGLNTNLFEKAQEQEAEGRGKNKAFGMMLKMGFKPGQALGRDSTVSESGNSNVSITSSSEASVSVSSPSLLIPTVPPFELEAKSGGHHISEPIRVSIWEGKQGIGQKRALPSTSHNNPYAPNKRTKLDEDSKQAREQETAEEFRARTRREYEDKRDEARLIAATRTCISLDEEKGHRKFNYMWLNPHNPNTCPPELLEAFKREAISEIDDDGLDVLDAGEDHSESGDDDIPITPSQGLPKAHRRRRTDGREGETDYAARLRAQMQRDALHTQEELGEEFETGLSGAQTAGISVNAKGKALDNEISDISRTTETLEFSEAEIATAREFLGLPANARLERVLKYMRDQYSYCFWCGTQYRDQDDLGASCPGFDEDSHE